jgi:hypothetical protein
MAILYQPSYYIDTDPCSTCDFAPCACGRDIEECTRHESNKGGASPKLIVGRKIFKIKEYPLKDK